MHSRNVVGGATAGPRSSASTIFTNTVVTPAKNVTPWATNCVSNVGGSLRVTRTTSPPALSVAIDVVTRPNAHASGRETRVTSRPSRCHTRAYDIAAANKPACECITPFGLEVDPEV